MLFVPPPPLADRVTPVHLRGFSWIQSDSLADPSLSYGVAELRSLVVSGNHVGPGQGLRRWLPEIRLAFPGSILLGPVLAPTGASRVGCSGLVLAGPDVFGRAVAGNGWWRSLVTGLRESFARRKSGLVVARLGQGEFPASSANGHG